MWTVRSSLCFGGSNPTWDIFVNIIVASSILSMVHIVLPAMPSRDRSDVLVPRNELVNCDVNKRIKAT